MSAIRASSRRSQLSRAALLVLLLVAASPCIAADAPAPSRDGAVVRFLTVEAARTAIVDDSADGYFHRLSDVEMAAKTGSPVPGETREERLEETRRRYQAGVRDFTEQERQALQWHVAGLDPLMRKHYPRLAAIPWSFLKVSRLIESGFPHTRGPHIVLSELVLAGLAATAGGDAPEGAVNHFRVLLLHEQLHVLQRSEPELFADLYTRVWKFRRVAAIAGAEAVSGRIVVNPDGPETVWIFPTGEGRWVWPLIVFPEGTTAERARLSRMQMVAVEIEAGDGEAFKVRVNETGSPLIRPLSEVEAYMKAFFPSGYVYHPNEASADLFARIVVHDLLGAGDDLPEDERERVEAGLKPVRQWFATRLGAQPGGAGGR